jgi:transcriptional regulator with XRE-family HTH domain
MANERLRSTLRASGYTEAGLADEVGVDPKTVQRWITRGRCPHPATAVRAAGLLKVPVTWLWPEMDTREKGAGGGDVVGFYAHRSEVPNVMFQELLTSARECIDVVTYAALHLVEDNPETIALLKHKAAHGVRVRVAIGDPDHSAIALRGYEERMGIGLVGRVRMANAYYSPLVGAPGVALRLHHTTLYNSLYRYDDQMLVNHHIYGVYGYLAPVLHLRRTTASDLFETYERSLEMIWEESYVAPTKSATHLPAPTA